MKIDSRSWRKRRYWKDAELESDSESSYSVLSNNDNKYDALCCWCVDGDDDQMDDQGPDNNYDTISCELCQMMTSPLLLTWILSSLKGSEEQILTMVLDSGSSMNRKRERKQITLCHMKNKFV